MPVTIRDIAERAGVSRMTVSRSLRNHPEVNANTRDRICRLAVEMGYSPNPLVSVWMTSVAAGKPTSLIPSIAWLGGYLDRTSRHNMLIRSGLFEAANKRAEQLGFRIEDHPLFYGGMEPRRLSAILRNRACPGVIVPPLPVMSEGLDFEWRPFSITAIGWSLRFPNVHRVTIHHGMGMTSTMENLAFLGWKRVGLVLKRLSDDRTNHFWSDAYLGFCWRHSEIEGLPIHMPISLDRREFLEWFRANKPDVIIGADQEIIDWYEEELRNEQNRKCAFIHLHEEFASDPRIFGVVTGEPVALARAAVNVLVSQIKQNDTGLPETPYVTMIPCKFRLRQSLKGGESKV